MFTCRDGKGGKLVHVFTDCCSEYNAIEANAQPIRLAENHFVQL